MLLQSCYQLQQCNLTFFHQAAAMKEHRWSNKRNPPACH